MGVPAVHPHTHFPALPVEGADDSAVQVETWEDLACKDAAAWRRMLDATILPAYGDRVRFVAHDFPLDKHPWAEAAAMASRRFASWDSAAGIEFRRYCLFHLEDISVENLPERVADFAVAQGFDAEDAELSLRSEDLRDAVRADAKAGASRGVEKTPTLFIGERALVETFSLKAVEEAIEAALAAASGR